MVYPITKDNYIESTRKTCFKIGSRLVKNSSNTITCDTNGAWVI